MTAPYDSPLPCEQPSCTGVIQCRCGYCEEHCACDNTPWEIDSGPAGPSASVMESYRRMRG